MERIPEAFDRYTRARKFSNGATPSEDGYRTCTPE